MHSWNKSDGLKAKTKGFERAPDSRGMLFDYSIDMLCIVGYDSRFERVSASFGTVLGWEEHELLSKPFLDFLHPDDHEPMRRALKLQRTSRKAKSFETRCRCSDGTYKWISWHVHTLLSEKLIVAVGRDITDRREAKEALRRSEALARTFLDLPLDISILMDREGMLIDFNDNLPKRLGRTREEIVGRCIFDLLPPDVGKARRTKAAELLKTGGVVRFEDRNGEFWYDSIVYPVLDDDGEIAKIAVLSYDITQRKKAEEALRASEALARALLNIPEDNVVVLLDTEGRVLDLNENLPRRLAMSKGGVEREPTREELVGREAVGFLSPDVARLRREKIKQVAVTGKPVRFEDCDSGVWYDNVIYPVMDDAKRVTKIAVFAYDISPIKKAEEDVRRLNEELEQKVADRTAELVSLNEMLTRDIAHRVKIEAELRARTDELYESNTHPQGAP